MSLRNGLGMLLRGSAACLLVLSVITLLAIGLLPRTGWYRTLTVLSGSMRPTFSPGDVVVARAKSADSLQLGDVLVYEIPVGDHQVESHRIIQIVSRHPVLVVRTKGDANKAADPWTAELGGDRFWTVRGSVPRLGQAILWLRSPRQHRIATYLLPALVTLLLLSAIWRRDDDGLLGTDALRHA
jgi:signal peptidase I